MSREWLVATRSDRGGGFRPDPDRSSPSLPAQVAAEFAALEPLYPQLAVGGAPGAEGMAVVTYRYSPRLSSWIVVVQGSAGQYGPAGTIQLAAVAGGGPLVDCLTGSLALVRREGWLAPGERDSPRVALKAPGPAVEGALAGLLTLDASRRVLLLPGTQGEVDQLLGWLSRILPERVAQAYTWSTSLAAARIEAGETVISGGWPDALRERHREIFRAFAARAGADSSPPAAGLPAGLAWALSQAGERRFPGRSSRAPDLAGWLDELEAQRPLTLAEALELLRGPIEGRQARRWADSGVSRWLVSDDMERLEALLTHPSDVVSRGAVDALELPGVWDHLVRLERARARRGQAPMVPPGLLETDALVLLAEDVTAGWDVGRLRTARPWLDGLGLTAETAPGLVVLTAAEQARALKRDPRRIRRLLAGGRAAELGAGYLTELVDQAPELLAPLAVEMARPGSGVDGDVARFLTGFPSIVAGRAAEGFLRDCARHLSSTAPREARAVRWRVAEAVAAVAAEHRTGRAVVDDAADAAILRFAVGATVVEAGATEPPEHPGRARLWVGLAVLVLLTMTLLVTLMLVL